MSALLTHKPGKQTNITQFYDKPFTTDTSKQTNITQFYDKPFTTDTHSYRRRKKPSIRILLLAFYILATSLYHFINISSPSTLPLKKKKPFTMVLLLEELGSSQDTLKTALPRLDYPTAAQLVSTLVIPTRYRYQ
eukprot:gene3768-2659_t